MKKFLLLVLAVAVCQSARAVYFTSAPGSVNSGDGYYVSAEEDTWSYPTEVYLYKNGAFFAYGSGYGSATAGDSTTDYGNQGVHYEAYSNWYDDYYNSYGDYTQTWVNVVQPNNAPTISWSQAPDWVPINQWFAVQAHGQDSDGNLTQVFVWKEWSPFAFNGGGNGYENYSDANGDYEGSAGSVTFMAQATDSNGATSAVIYHTVNIYVPNSSPTVAWVNNPASAWVNQAFNVQARANDADSNLSWIYVWKDEQPFAFNGASGSVSYSDNNAAVATSPVNVGFKALAGDSAGADSGFIYHTVTINNHAPTSPTISVSVNGVALANNGYMWLNDAVSITGTVHDDDGNLSDHAVYWQKVTGSSPTGNWNAIDNDHTPSNGTNSSKTKSFTPNAVGRWDYHTNGGDNGGLWTASGGASLTTYVYGSNNDAVFVSQSVPSTMTTGDSFQVSITMGNAGTSNRPWINDSSPHKLKAIATPNWGVSAVALPGGTTVFPSPQTPNTAIFVFNVTAPPTPGPHQFQWQMEEEFPGNPALFGAPSTLLTINVNDNDPPSAPTNLTPSNTTPTSFRLSWTAATDNGPVLSYDVYRTINGVTTLVGNTTGTFFDVTGLVSGLTYTMKVVAKDGASPPLTTASANMDITTIFDPLADNDGDGVNNGTERLLLLDPNDSNDVRVFRYEYDKINQLQRGPGGEYRKDAEGNIQHVRP